MSSEVLDLELPGSFIRLARRRPWWAFWRRRFYRGVWMVESIDRRGDEISVHLVDAANVLRRPVMP